MAEDRTSINDIKLEHATVVAQSDLKVASRLQQNRISDLDDILNQRACIHTTNIALMYLFHFTQTAGIFIVSLCTSLELNKYIWIGISMNALASVFEAIRQANTKISAKKLKDLESIKRGTYIDEGDVDFAPDRRKSSQVQQKLQPLTYQIASQVQPKTQVDDFDFEVGSITSNNKLDIRHRNDANHSVNQSRQLKPQGSYTALQQVHPMVPRTSLIGDSQDARTVMMPPLASSRIQQETESQKKRNPSVDIVQHPGDQV